MCSSSAAHTLDTHRIMHAYLALVIALAAPALVAPETDRLNYKREILSRGYSGLNVDSLVLTDTQLNAHKHRGKLITKPRPIEDVAEDNVLLQSNVLSIVRPAKRNVESQVSDALVRQRRGYNLENVRVPARYPYLPVPTYNRFRRWG